MGDGGEINEAMQERRRASPERWIRGEKTRGEAKRTCGGGEGRGGTRLNGMKVGGRCVTGKQNQEIGRRQRGRFAAYQPDTPHPPLSPSNHHFLSNGQSFHITAARLAPLIVFFGRGKEGGGFDSGPGAFLRGPHMFSLSLCRLSPGSPASLNSPKNMH